MGQNTAVGGLSSPSAQYAGSTGASRTTRRRCRAAFSFSQLKLEFTNSPCDVEPTTASEHGDITIAASVETAGGALTQVTFDGGSTTKVLTKNTTVLSDAASFTAAEGDIFWVRTYVSAGTGLRYPLNMLTDQTNGEGTVNSVNQTMSGTISSSNAKSFTATAVVAPRPAPVTNLLIVGDSITAGRTEATDQTLSDHQRGWAARAFGGIYPFYRLAMGGDRANLIPTNWPSRQTLPATGGFSHAIVLLGVNDIQDAAQTGANVISSLDTIYQWLQDAGIPRIYAVTIPPFSVTGTYTSAGGQTVNSTFDGYRQTVNTSIRALSNSRLYGYIDAAAAVEDGSNAGKWRSDGGVAYSDDGTHPNTLGHQTIANAITTKTFAV
ncbi:hypothetical protein EPO04_01255 [Patescibacteria group bacterium]|nr:MAG: hypothetical protein EPO04_01255 [Patescibacteria group bacterium]